MRRRPEERVGPVGWALAIDPRVKEVHSTSYSPAVEPTPQITPPARTTAISTIPEPAPEPFQGPEASAMPRNYALPRSQAHEDGTPATSSSHRIRRVIHSTYACSARVNISTLDRAADDQRSSRCRAGIPSTGVEYRGTGKRSRRYQQPATLPSSAPGTQGPPHATTRTPTPALPEPASRATLARRSRAARRPTRARTRYRPQSHREAGVPQREA